MCVCVRACVRACAVKAPGGFATAAGAKAAVTLKWTREELKTLKGKDKDNVRAAFTEGVLSTARLAALQMLALKAFGRKCASGNRQVFARVARARRTGERRVRVRQGR